MKLAIIFLSIFPILTYSQIELKFSESYISGEKKISLKPINANSMVTPKSDDLKYWIKSEPRKLSTSEEKYNSDPNNFPLITDYDIYIYRVSINCKKKIIKTYEMYQYDANNKTLKFHEDYSQYDSEGLKDLNNPTTKYLYENTSLEPEDIVYLKKCEKK